MMPKATVSAANYIGPLVCPHDQERTSSKMDGEVTPAAIRAADEVTRTQNPADEMNQVQ